MSVAVDGFAKNRRVLPGFGLSLGVALAFISLILLLPMSALVAELSHLSLPQYWTLVTNPQVLAALRVTVVSALCAALFNGFAGVLLAWILVRYRFPGRRMVDALIDLPFALPTAVAGLTLASLFSADGLYGGWLQLLGVKVSYTWLGIAVAMAFTSLPFVVRTVQPVLEDLGRAPEEAAATLGAGKFDIFRRVIFPEIFPSALAGVMLAFCRSLGEFGGVIFIAGNIAYETEVLSLMIFVRLQEYDYPAAAAIASIVLALSLTLFVLSTLLQKRFAKRIGAAS